MKILGTAILITSFVASPYLLFIQDMEISKVTTFAVIGIFCGLGLLIAERITSISAFGAEIKATTEKARLEARQIETMLNEIQTQKGVIDLMVRDANLVQERVAEIEDIAQGARQKAEQIEFTAQEAKSRAKKAEEDITKIVKTFDDRVAKVLLEAFRGI